MPGQVTTAMRRLVSDAAGPRKTVRRGHLYLLDAARGCAALAVLFFHYVHFFFLPGTEQAMTPTEAYPLYGVFWLFFSYGKAAVPVFWMISGFVFSRVYRDSAATSQEFFLNRFARLYPLHLLTLLLVAMLQAVAVARYGHAFIYGNNDLYHFVLQLFFASNWGLQVGDSFNGPIWSVSVEVAVYVVFWAFHRRLFALGVIGPVALMLAGFILFMGTGNLIGQCGFFFFIGAALHYVHEAFEDDRRLIAAAVVGMMAAGLLAFASGIERIENGVGVPAFFGGLILLLVSVEAAAAPYKRWLAPVGDNTYGMYLLHVPLQLVIFIVLSRSTDVAALALSPWFLLGYIAAVIVLARISFLHFERPMRIWLRRLGEGRAVVDRPELAAP